MGGIKVPQRDFALKMRGGGRRICGTLRYYLLCKEKSAAVKCLAKFALIICMPQQWTPTT